MWPLTNLDAQNQFFSGRQRASFGQGVNGTDGTHSAADWQRTFMLSD